MSWHVTEFLWSTIVLAIVLALESTVTLRKGSSTGPVHSVEPVLVRTTFRFEEYFRFHSTSGLGYRNARQFPPLNFLNENTHVVEHSAAPARWLPLADPQLNNWPYFQEFQLSNYTLKAIILQNVQEFYAKRALCLCALCVRNAAFLASNHRLRRKNVHNFSSFMIF